MPDPDLLILDEPGASLDLGARETLVRDLGRLAAGDSPRGIVLVTHHVEEIPPGFGRALVLGRGRAIAAGEVAASLTGPILSEAFGLPIDVEDRRSTSAPGWPAIRTEQPGESTVMQTSHIRWTMTP